MRKSSFERWPWTKSFGLIRPLPWYWSILTGDKIWIGVKCKMCLLIEAICVWNFFFTFHTGQKTWKFIWVKGDFLLHWIVSAIFTSKYTKNSFILSFKFGQFHQSSLSLEVFCVLVSARPDNFSTQIWQESKQIWLQMWFKCFNFT